MCEELRWGYRVCVHFILVLIGLLKTIFIKTKNKNCKQRSEFCETIVYKQSEQSLYPPLPHLRFYHIDLLELFVRLDSGVELY